ncbi:MAG: metal ABC transporter ATP-binding protein [Anaerolineaceae bacterium]|nr:metal ABC transporter ATP-binding protein [Anaerolineaceae bacterium]
MSKSSTHGGENPARLEVENLSVAYNGKPVLQNLSFSVPVGDRVAVVGPNGAGKSTLFKALVGLLPVLNGRILIHGRALENRRDCVAYVPQREEVDWRFPVTVEDVVMMGRFGQLKQFERPGRYDRERVEQAMQQMDIHPLARHPIGDLSGGQQQRAFLARALAQEPHILLLDEPFTGVDASTQQATMALLDQLHANHVTVLVSTHDLGMVTERFERVLLINHRLIAYGTPAEVFNKQSVSEAFGGQVLHLDGALVVDQCCGPEENEERGQG